MSSDVKKLIGLTAPGVVGLFILAYNYCAPGLARIPNEWNYLIGRVLFVGCFLGGTVTSVLAMAVLKAVWEKLDGIFKSMVMLLNLGWLGAVVYLAIQLHTLYAGR